MKKLFIALSLIACSVHISSAQVKGQLTQLEELGEGSVFKQYYAVTKNGDSYSAEAGQTCELKFVKNVNNKLSAFELNKEGKNENLINCGFGFLKPNHYTEPSMFHSKIHSMAYVYIDGLLYCLKSVSDPTAVNTIVLENIYVLTKPAKGEHTSGKAASKELKKRNHEEVIKQYLNDMKAVQDKATANFTDEIKTEIAAVEDKAAAKKAADKAKNDAFWASEQGQKVANEYKQAAQNEKTIHNTGKTELVIMLETGFTHRILAGSKKNLACDENVYYAIKKNDGNNTVSTNYSKGTLISGKNQDCGKTIAAASGN